MLPDGDVRDQAELYALGGIAVVAEHSTVWASAELGLITAREVELCARLGYPLEYVRSLVVRWIFLINQAHLGSALELSGRLLRWGQERGDLRGLIMGHLCAGFSNAMRGDLSPARSHLEEGMRLYASCSNDPTVIWHRKIVADPDWPVHNGNAYLGLVSCWTGYPDQALAHGLAAVDLGDRSPGTAAWCPQHRRAIQPLFRLRIVCFLIEPMELRQLARELVMASNEQGLPHIGAIGTVFEGYAIARCVDPKAGRTVIREGVAAYAATGGVLWSCYFNALLAETYQLEDNADEALPILTEALALTERTGEQWYAAELHRRIGEAHHQHGDRASAERSFAQALAIARSQGARLWELRAANSYALLLRDQGKRTEARALLAPVYGWFTEGFATVPLREAKTLLDELGRVDAEP
jgi:tetratricopeptide (TPR) repeat protein